MPDAIGGPPLLLVLCGPIWVSGAERPEPLTEALKGAIEAMAEATGMELDATRPVIEGER
jgi:hypothetical protein